MYDNKEVDAEQLRPAWSAGDPTAAVVPPGLCQLTDEFTDCTLEERTWVSDDSFVARFGLPDAESVLASGTPIQCARAWLARSANVDVGSVLLWMHPCGPDHAQVGYSIEDRFLC